MAIYNINSLLLSQGDCFRKKNIPKKHNYFAVNIVYGYPISQYLVLTNDISGHFLSKFKSANVLTLNLKLLIDVLLSVANTKSI